jgi:FAD/FMN-containing dehydrogenase
MNRRQVLRMSAGIAAAFPFTRLVVADSTALPSDAPATSLSGGSVSLRGADIKQLAAGMRGQVIVPGQEGYDQARRVWNAMISKRPALIARCAAPSDVIRAVAFAKEHQLLTAVRAGGHSVSGKSTCDGGILIDVSSMQGVRVDPDARIARIEGGALLGHLDREAQQFGLVTTAGTVSHTGAAGLTLGGGLGRVCRRFGLACDNLRSVDVVTADGRLVTANTDTNADLFWAVRGGGGNFGVVTSFEYQLHPMDPVVLAGRVDWPMAQARDALSFYAEFSSKAPDELHLDLGVHVTPAGGVVSVRPCWSAKHAQGEKILQPLRAFGRPARDEIVAMPYVKLQQLNDSHNGWGRRFYAKSGFVDEFTPRLIEQIIDIFSHARPGSFSLVAQQAGGGVGRVPVDATAFANRSAGYWVMLSQGWSDPAEDGAIITAIRTAWQRIEPLTSGFYTNAMSEAEDARVAANFGPNYSRLRQVKRKYDPHNQFRLNANIAPA